MPMDALGQGEGLTLSSPARDARKGFQCSEKEAKTFIFATFSMLRDPNLPAAAAKPGDTTHAAQAPDAPPLQQGYTLPRRAVRKF